MTNPFFFDHIYRRNFRLTMAGLIVLTLLLANTSILLAHPLGNFTINRYSRLELNATQVALTYIVDMAEIPTQQMRPQLDTNGNGTISPAEQTAYLATELGLLQENLHLTVNGARLSWALADSQLTFPDGQAGLPTQRLYTQWLAELPTGQSTWQATYQDNNFAGRLGWQEVVVQDGDAVNLLASSVPATDISQALTSYPDDLLQSPPTVSQATFRFGPVSVHGETTGLHANAVDSVTGQDALLDTTRGEAGTVTRAADPFADLIRLPTLDLWTIVLALLAAFGWGAAHALSPGHGKTIVGAYLVGSRGTAKHALFLGLTTTITHTAGVFAIGLVTLFASRYILPETLFPWLSLFSGLLVVVIGLTMAHGWLRGRWAQHLPIVQHADSHDHTHHNHDHDHSHDHAHDHAHPHTHHQHAHDHPHAHEHDELHTHDGVHYHSHDVPGQDGTPVTWRNLLALGVSGGLLPCPSALVVMLGAIALQRVAFGLVLIVAFSLGLAGVLTAFGLALVYAGKLFSLLPDDGHFARGRRLVQLLPVGSALFITAVGVGITVQALAGI